MIFQVAYQAPEQKEPDTAAGKKPARSDRPGSLALKKPRQGEYGPKLRQDEFSYFNRSAITMPLRSDRQPQAHKKDRTHVLGGLMVLNKRNEVFQEQDAQLIRILADQASAFLQVAEIYENTGELFLGVIKAMVAAIDAKDAYTQGHSQRVSDYSVMIARELKLDETLVTDIRIGSLLHDIGKIGIPDSILTKPGSLTEAELFTMRLHPHLGVNILSQVKAFDQMQPAIIEHHERLDGSGYPNKLVGRQISMMGRIVAVADVFDAMTSDRPYRQAVSYQKVISFLEEKADVLFDASCVAALKNILSAADSEN
jgi:putative nucleotidyltransferase with HDIG domain